MFSVNRMFGHHMILQRQKPIKIWGSGTIGTEISIALTRSSDAGEECLALEQVSVDDQGNWLAELAPQEATYNVSLSLTDGDTSIRFSDIAIGEVWIAGGQSNMEYHVHFDDNKEEILSGLMNHHIRYFNYPQISIPEMEDRFDYSDFGFWRTCTPQDLPHFSSVAYYFANDVSLSLDIPIGIIGCNWGGTPACAWLDPAYLRGTPGQVWLDDYNKKLINLDWEKDKKNYLNHPNSDTSHPLKPVDGLLGKVMSPGLSEAEQASLVKLTLMEDTRLNPVSGGPHHHYRPGGLYEMMVKSIAPYSCRGVIWYQGESDSPHADVYYSVFSQLIQCWRDLWQETLPVLFVQLAPFGQWLAIDGSAFPELRRQQQKVANQVNATWMVSSSDAGMKIDIHPKVKKPIGQRLALLALKNVYHRAVLADAPQVRDVQKFDDLLHIAFDYADGLHVCGDKLNALLIRGENGDAVAYDVVSVKDDGLTLAGKFAQKLHIQFACTPYYQVNLYNRSLIPAMPFATSI